ncbi:MAG: multidrug effflux MFS transporter [Hyphomicrobiaceae bacterium]
MERAVAFVGVAGVLFAMAPFGIDMYLPALPEMARALATDIDAVETSVAVFLLGYAVSQLLLGPLSDQYGRIKIILAGAALYIVGSVLCALSTSIELLYTARLIQAFGGGASVTVFALVKERFDERTGTQIISYILAITVIAPLVAPVVGGFVLTVIGWRAIFIVLAAWGGLALWLVWQTWKPLGRPPESSGAIGEAIRAYRRVLSHGDAMLFCLVGAFTFAGFFAFIAGSPFVYIEHFGVEPQYYGLLVAMNAVVMMAANMVNARLLADIAPERKALWGAGAVAMAAVLCATAAVLGIGLWGVVTCVIIYIGALGLTSANATASALKRFAHHDAGTGSAINGVLMFGIGAVSSAIVGAVTSADAKPMLFTMAACGLLTLLSAIPLLRKVKQK